MAKPPGVDNLLSDLLNEAKKGVEAEQQTKVDAQAEQRDAAVREKREREEAWKREQGQQQIIAESRRRNEALAKRDREGERKSVGTAKHQASTQPVPEAPAAAAAAVPAAKGKPTSKLVLAGLVAGGMAIGVGTGFALQPERKGTFPDIADAARSLVAQVSKSAAAERKLTGELDAMRQKVSGLESQVGGAGADVTKLRAELDQFKTDLAKAKKDLEDAKAGAGAGAKKTGGGGGGGGDGLPSLDGGAFGGGKKKTP